MIPAVEIDPALRRSLYALLITVAIGMAVGRVLAAELVYEPSLSEPRAGDPGHPKRKWPATAPRPTPMFSSNDRSRWATVRALVDDGTFVIGHRSVTITRDSAVALFGSQDALQTAVLLGAGRSARLASDRGIVFEDGWQTVDKVLKPDTLDYYSTKPPLLSVMVAGEYWLLKKTLGWTLTPRADGSDDRFAVVRTVLLTINVLPLLLYLVLLGRLLDRYGTTAWGRLYVLAAACFATLVTPFLVTFNNHTVATVSALIAVYAGLYLLSAVKAGSWWVYVAAGLCAGFTAANELPAAALAAGLFVVLLPRSPRRTLLGFVPAMLIPGAALLALNYVALGQLRPAYSEFGGPWYQYEGSHWLRPAGTMPRGIDFARQHETRAAYALHLLVGHHGLFSLTPIFLLTVAGMGMGTRRLLRFAREMSCRAARRQPAGADGTGELTPRRSPTDIWNLFSAATLLLSLVVVGFYLFKSDNYGGWSAGPRWLMWLTPLWLLCMLPVVDQLGRRRWGRGLALALLALSVLAMSYPAWNPWRHPWIYNALDARGWIPY